MDTKQFIRATWGYILYPMSVILTVAGIICALYGNNYIATQFALMASISCLLIVLRIIQVVNHIEKR